MLYAVIMAGGAGSRLWPYSRQNTPKQLLDLLGSQSLLQQTCARLEQLVSAERILVVTGASLEAATRAQLPQLPPQNVIIEPAARNTAPAIGLAALHIARLAATLGDTAPIMGSFHADHIILEQDAFVEAVHMMEAVAQAGYLATLGITPNYAHTGYGYIEVGTDIDVGESVNARRVAAFTEKPSQAVAEEYLAGGRHLWNSGMFMWQVAVLMDEFAHYTPALYSQIQAIAPVLDDPAAVEKVWRGVKSVAIDTAIAEQSGRLAVVPGSIGWNDVGDWSTLAALIGQTHGYDGESGNALSLGVHSRFIGLDTTDSLIFCRRTLPPRHKRLIATIGMNDCIVVDTDDILLVAPRARNQDVKKIVERLRDTDLHDYL